MSTAALKRLSWTEYVARERAADYKSEFYDGELFAMAGASRRHNVIAGNVARQLGNALDGRACEVYPSDMRVRCPNGLGAYPDVSVACGPEFEDKREDTLLNPVLIVEVLSPTTEAYDRGKKFESYRGMPSLREYVLVSQDRRQVEHYARQSGNNRWLLTSYSDTDDRIELPALGMSVSIDEVYSQLEFTETGPSESAQAE